MIRSPTVRALFTFVGDEPIPLQSRERPRVALRPEKSEEHLRAAHVMLTLAIALLLAHFPFVAAVTCREGILGIMKRAMTRPETQPRLDGEIETHGL